MAVSSERPTTCDEVATTSPDTPSGYLLIPASVPESHLRRGRVGANSSRGNKSREGTPREQQAVPGESEREWPFQPMPRYGRDGLGRVSPRYPRDSLLVKSLIDLQFPDLDLGSTIWDELAQRPTSGLMLSSGCMTDLRGVAIFPEDDLSWLAALSAGYLVEAVANAQRLDELLAVAMRVVDLDGAAEEPPLNLGCPTPFLDSLPRAAHHLPLIPEATPPLALNYCRKRAYSTFGDLRHLSEARLVAELGLTGDTIALVASFWACVVDLSELLSTGVPFWVEKESRWEGRGLETLVREALEEAMPKDGRPRNLEVLVRRLGLSGRSCTHRSVGEQLGISGARAQQIDSALRAEIDEERFGHALLPLRFIIYSYLCSQGGAAPTGGVVRYLTEFFEWQIAPNTGGVGKLVAHFSEFSRGTSQDSLAIAALSCATCSSLWFALGALIDEEGCVEAEIASARVATHCQCGTDRSSCPVDHPSAQLLLGLAEHSSPVGLNLKAQDGWLMRKDCSARPESLAFRVTTVLKKSGQAMHHSEVYEELTRTSRPPTRRNVYAALERASSVVSWGTGSFIHLDSIRNDGQLVKEIAEWVWSQLTAFGAPPFLSVHAPFSAHESACRASAIPSELALYALLRRSGDSRLTYPRYPQVYLAHTFDGRQPLRLYVEELLLEAGGPLSESALRETIVRRMGFKDFQFEQVLSALPDVLRLGDKSIMHADYLWISRAEFLHFSAAVLDRYKTALHVAARRIFEDFRVDCSLMRIADAEMLHSLFRRFEPLGIVSGRYPRINLRGGSNRSATVTGAVLAYVANRRGPVSFDELEAEFVEKLGYSAQSVYAVANHPEVFRYLPATVVHASAMGWTDGLQAAVEKLGALVFEAESAEGHLYATIDDLLEELPGLRDGMVWTKQLVGDMLSRNGGFLMLGNARNAYVPKDNCRKYATLADLVEAILREEYGGGANLEVLEKRLREGGVILGKLTPTMLGGSGQVVIRDQEVWLAELLHA